MLLAKIEEINHPSEWKKLVFSIDCLVEAIREDKIREVVRESVKLSYGELDCFSRIVDDITRSLCIMIAGYIQDKSKGNSLAVLLNHDLIVKEEESYKKLYSGFKFTGICWRGENDNV